MESNRRFLSRNVVSVLSILWGQYTQLKAKLIKFEKEKNALIRQIEPCQRLMEIEEVGETTAAMVYTTLGDGKQFKNGRQASAFVGLTPNNIVLEVKCLWLVLISAVV
nr:transposase [Vibrio tasmaniensis]